MVREGYQLFGRNTIGGVINVTRSKPTGKFGGRVRAGYGDYDTYDVEGIFNFPITTNLAAKLSAATHQQREGYFTMSTPARTSAARITSPSVSTCCSSQSTRWSSSTRTTGRERIRTLPRC